jgi:hypothetical protein
MKFNITNTTKNKVVLANKEAQDADHAAGQYISVLIVAGIIKSDRADVVWTGKNTFRIPAKGWDFEVAAA